MARRKETIEALHVKDRALLARPKGYTPHPEVSNVPASLLLLLGIIPYQVLVGNYLLFFVRTTLTRKT